MAADLCSSVHLALNTYSQLFKVYASYAAGSIGCTLKQSVQVSLCRKVQFLHNI